tara:strand:+ start:44 stop:169 length:126 start_codon:yes stop_codon:yes gene_type:complete
MSEDKKKKEEEKEEEFPVEFDDKEWEEKLKKMREEDPFIYD